LNPIQVRYQAALRPDENAAYRIIGLGPCKGVSPAPFEGVQYPALGLWTPFVLDYQTLPLIEWRPDRGEGAADRIVVQNLVSRGFSLAMSSKKATPAKKDKEEKVEKKNGNGKAKDEPKKVAKAKEEEPAPKKTAKAEAPAKAEKAEKPAEKAAKVEKSEPKASKSARGSSSAKVYQPANSYTVGEMIFHPVWKVEGTVVEVGKTPDGNTKIVVDFPDFGVKRLIAEHQAKV
jgi:hypothetical protein